MSLATLLLVSAAVQDAVSKARQPIPVTAGRWRIDDDYPSGSFRRGETGTVQIELDVDAGGRVTGCRVTGSSGYWELDEPVCPRISKALSFKPALDAAGVPIASHFTTWFNWSFPGNTSGAFARTGSGQQIEFGLTVARLPANYRQPALLRLRFASGKPVDCKLERSSGSAGIDTVACSQALQRVSAPTAKKGAPRPDAATVTVWFENETKTS